MSRGPHRGGLLSDSALADVVRRAAFDTVQKQALERLTDDKWRGRGRPRSSDSAARPGGRADPRSGSGPARACGQRRGQGMSARSLWASSKTPHLWRRSSSGQDQGGADGGQKASCCRSLRPLPSPGSRHCRLAPGPAVAGPPAREQLCSAWKLRPKTQDFEDASAGLLAGLREVAGPGDPCPPAIRYRSALMSGPRYHERHDAFLKKQPEESKGAQHAAAGQRRAARRPIPAAPPPPTPEELARQAAAESAAPPVCRSRPRRSSGRRSTSGATVRSAARGGAQPAPGEQAALLRAEEEKRQAEQKAQRAAAENFSVWRRSARSWRRSPPERI